MQDPRRRLRVPAFLCVALSASSCIGVDQDGLPTATQFVTAPTGAVPGSARLEVAFTQPGTDPTLDDTLVALVDGARSTVDLAVFDFDRQNVIDALVAASRRGVRVRMVGDGDNAMEAGYVQLAAAGVPIVSRNPGYAIMHDKFVVVDGRFVWTGSTNPSDNDVLRNHNQSLVLENTGLAQAFTYEFEQMFVTSRFGVQKRDVAGVHTFTINGVQVEAFFGPPDGLMRTLLARLDTAETSVHAMVFSFTDEQLSGRMLEIAGRGIPVRVVFDTLQAGNASSQDERLATGGVPTWLDGTPGASGGGLLHHKVLVVDAEGGADPLVVTGSFNWSAGADQDNDETLLVIHHEGLARAYLREWCSVQANASVHPGLVGRPDPGCRGRAVINEVLANPWGTDTGEEYVELVNVGPGPLDVSGWTLAVNATQRHRFADGWMIPSGGVVVVYDGGLHPSVPGALASSSGALSLPNAGATVILRNRENVTVDTFQYGASLDGISKNRSPDTGSDAGITDHSRLTAGVRSTSPGTYADGSAFTAPGRSTVAPLPTPLAHQVLVTQLATRGPTSAADEFIEIYNATDKLLDVGGLRVQTQSTSCGTWTERYVLPQGLRLQPGQFHLAAGTAYASPTSGPVPDARFASALADAGVIRVLAADGTEIDRVAYGSGVTCAGASAAPSAGTSPNGASIWRAPGQYSNARPARDTDMDAADFVVSPARAPRNLATPVQPSVGDSKPVAGELLVSQLATRGPRGTADDFVELYNATSRRILLDGMRLQYRTASCGAWSDRWLAPAGLQLLPGQFLLLVNPAAYQAPQSGPLGDGGLTSGLGDVGVVRLLSGSTVLDAVAFGTGMQCVGEGTAAAPAHATTTPLGSVVRHPWDTGASASTAAPASDRNDNGADFAVRATRLPRALLSTPEPSR